MSKVVNVRVSDEAHARLSDEARERGVHLSMVARERLGDAPVLGVAGSGSRVWPGDAVVDANPGGATSTAGQRQSCSCERPVASLTISNFCTACKLPRRK